MDSEQKSIIKDGEKYLTQLYKLISENDQIVNPKSLEGFVVRRKVGNKLISWEIHNKQVELSTGDNLHCDERAIKDLDKFKINKFSYHFQPDENNEIYSYRIDLDSRNGVHLNIDEKLIESFGDHIKADQVPVDILNFNCLLAINLSLMYIKYQVYILEDKAKDHYNSKINGARRLYE